MPSLRTIFIAAATGLVSFAIAAPLNVPTTVGARGVTDGLPLAFLTGSSSGAEAAAGSASGAGGILGVRDATDGLPLAFLTGSASGAEAAAGSVSGGVLGVRGAEPDSLPVVLNCLVGKLEALLAKLSTSSSLALLVLELIFLLAGEYGSKSNVEPSLLEPILEELKMILCEALVAVKLLVGLPLDVVLCLAGKILAAIDIAHILCTVLSVRPNLTP